MFLFHSEPPLILDYPVFGRRDHCCSFSLLFKNIFNSDAVWPLIPFNSIFNKYKVGVNIDYFHSWIRVRTDPLSCVYSIGSQFEKDCFRAYCIKITYKFWQLIFFVLSTSMGYAHTNRLMSKNKNPKTKDFLAPFWCAMTVGSRTLA